MLAIPLRRNVNHLTIWAKKKKNLNITNSAKLSSDLETTTKDYVLQPLLNVGTFKMQVPIWAIGHSHLHEHSA